MTRTSRARIRLAIIVLVAAACGGCTSPQALAGIQEQLNQAADAVNGINVNLSVLQSTIDSLTAVVAKQDTTISRLANATGVQVVR